MSTHRIHPLMLGEAHVPRGLDVFWSLTRTTGTMVVPYLAFLVDGPEPILVDTGMRDAARATEVHGLGAHRRPPEWTLAAQLGRFGLGLEDIRTVVLTHLHYDHAGGCELLPNARFLVQRTELMAAAAPIGARALEMGGDLFYDRRDVAALVDPLWDRVELLEGDVDLAPGIRCVLYENSHTPGSQSVYVDTDEGTAAIVGDIVRRVDLNVRQAIPPGLFYDLEAIRRAMLDIRRRARHVFPAHDPSLVPVEAGAAV